MPVDVARALQIRASIARMRDGQEVVASGEDRLIDKHGAELFGSVAAPDLTPPEARYVAPRMVLLEWVGQASPLQSEVVIALKARGMLTPFHRLVLEQAALKCIARVDGLTSRTLTPRDGLSQTVRWGPVKGTYVQEVPMADAERIFASPSGDEFRLVGKGVAEQPHQPDEAWQKVLRGLEAVCRLRGQAPPPSLQEAARLRLRIGPEEKLASLAANSNAHGYWKEVR